MDVLSKPAIRIHPTAPIVEVNDPDDIQNQINSSLYDEKECNLLFEEIEIMRKDYDNWETIFKDIYSKVKPEIILWEKAYKDVCEMLEKNNTQENFTGSECGPYVRIVHQYKQSRFLKKESEEELPLFTLPKALALIQQKIISLKTSMINVQIDEQYVSLQRDKINCIEKCLKNRERYLTHKRIAEEKLASSTDNLEKESQESSEGQQDCNEKFKEVMSLVEKDASLLSEIRNDISLLFNELPSFQSEDEPDSGVNLVRKEIDELLLNWGKEKEQKKTLEIELAEDQDNLISCKEFESTETTCASQIGKEDHNFVRNHRDEINCIEKCIKKKEILLAQNKIAVEKLKKISAHLARESHRFSEDLQISDGEFNEFMLGVEQDNNSLSHITEDIVLLFNELSTLHSKFGTNSGINSVKKEIDELLLELGKEKNQAKPTDLFKNDLIVSNGIHPNENNSCAIDSTGNLTKNNWNKDETNSTEGNIIEFESLKDTFTSHLGKKDHKNVNSGSEKMNLIKRCIQKKKYFWLKTKLL
ncbi:uncharacterized protein LOC108095066 [Drosophila ficusphila]|uniref:uncharacterized protein LOC108095066 n=1 Tax=Drosophila ficusphila TaxID=30025 RepID=UPI001C8A877D|nr:uncharacterized protein LOC108095066 [Drosophila ficusphila]